jgi:hypothetical protein
MRETLTITIKRGKRTVEHHIDAQLLCMVKGKEAQAAILWGEYLIAKQSLDYLPYLPPKPRTK